MAPKYNFSIDQGTDILKAISIKAPDGSIVDLTGSTLRSQIRTGYDSPTVIAAFDFMLSDINLESGKREEAAMSLPNAITTTMPPGKYMYDVEWVNKSGGVLRILEGKITVYPEVTR